MGISALTNDSIKIIKTDWEKLGLKGKVKYLNVSIVRKNSSTTFTDSYEINFNNYGLITKIKLPGSPSPILFGEDGERFSYDTINGVQMRKLWKLGEMNAIVNYKYNGNNTIETSIVLPDGFTIRTQKFEYPSNGGTVVKELAVVGKGIYATTLSIYDKAGRLIEKNSQTEGHNLYKYDNSNNIIEIKTISNKDGGIRTTEFKPSQLKLEGLREMQIIHINLLETWLEETFQIDKILVKCGESKKIQGVQVSKLKCDTKSNWTKTLINNGDDETTSLDRELTYF